MTGSSSPRDRSPRSWLPPTSFGAIRQEVNDLVESLLGDALPHLRGEQVPRLDLSETAEQVEVTVDVPGFLPDQVHVDLAENYLVISGTHEPSAEEPDGSRKFHKLERRMASFSRSVLLPCPVDESKVDAEMKNGVLMVRLQKRDDVRRRRVPIRDGESSPEGTA